MTCVRRTESFATTVQEKLVNSEAGNPCVQKHLLARGANLVLVPGSLVAAALDTASGAIVGVGALATLGLHAKTVKVSVDLLNSSGKLLANPFKYLVKTINPEAGFAFAPDDCGIATYYTSKALHTVIQKCGDPDVGFLKRHVASRLTWALLAVSCLVTRAVDGVIGSIAAVFAILTVGKFDFLNILAYASLQIPSILQDLFVCTVKIINPQADIGAYLANRYTQIIS